MLKRCQKYANKDPWKHIPFVETDPPSAGVTYWLACAVIVGVLGALTYLGVGL